MNSQCRNRGFSAPAIVVQDFEKVVANNEITENVCITMYKNVCFDTSNVYSMLAKIIVYLPTQFSHNSCFAITNL